MCICKHLFEVILFVLSMSDFPSFDIPPGYQFNPSVLSALDPALTFLTPEGPETPETPEPIFELLLTLIQPSRNVCTAGRKTKLKKPDPEIKGPYNIPLSIEWDAFLGTLAEKIGVERSDLLVASFSWHWVKPASSQWLPVRDENGFASMVKKIKTKSETRSETDVMLRMDAPSKSSASLGNARDIAEETDIDLEENPVAKKVRRVPNLKAILFNLLQIKLDDALEEIVMKLTDKYPPGLCPLHPDLPCFHHRAADLHFKLDRPRLLVWAQAIKSGMAMYEKAPIVSPMFHMSHAIKHASKKSTDSPTTTSPPAMSPAEPSTSAPQVQMPVMPFPALFQYPQIPFPQVSPQAPFFMGYGGSGMPYSGHPFFAAGTGMEAMPRALHHQSRSLPSSPPTTTCTTAEFCKLYDLGEQAKVGLDALGFQFGDDLCTVTENQYLRAGFKPLEWQRVLKAYRQLKEDNRRTP
jgi:hypothetical protein